MSDIFLEYQSLDDGMMQNIKFAKSYRIVPTKNDYQFGYVNRYFLKKINESILYEVSKENFDKVSKFLYKNFIIEWKISGPKNNKYNENILLEKGVEEFNKEQIELLKKNMPDIRNVKFDFLEFWQGY